MVPLFSAGYFGAKKSKCTITVCRRASELKQCAGFGSDNDIHKPRQNSLSKSLTLV